MESDKKKINYSFVIQNNFNMPKKKAELILPISTNINVSNSSETNPLFVDLNKLSEFVEKHIHYWKKFMSSKNIVDVCKNIENLNKYNNYIYVIRKLAIQAGIAINENIVDINKMIEIINERKKENINTIEKENILFISLDIYDYKYATNEIKFHLKELDACYLVLEISKVMASQDYNINIL
jgi:hypothetical protein